MGWLKSFKNEKSSIVELSSAIFKNSTVCAEALKEYVNDSTEEERLKIRMYMTLEFIYFWMHITNRIAFAVLGNDLRVKLQKELGLLVIEPTVESFFGHWTDKLKQGLLMDIFEKLNDSEIQYSNCKAIKPKDNSFPYKALFSKLAINVAGVSGQPNNLEMLIHINTISLDAFKNMRLKELVDAVGKEL